MLTAIDECDGERVLTLRIDEPSIDAELVRAIESVLDDVAAHGVENLVFQFTGEADSVMAGEFPSWQPGPARSDMRYFARWDELLGRISRLRAKTLTAYDGRVGAAAVQVGFVTDIRLSSARARLSLGSLSEGRFPGMGAYWLPKFVGLGNARRIFLVGADLTAERASSLGLVDIVDDTVEVAIGAAMKAVRPVSPEAACFTRRILDDCYGLEPAAAAEACQSGSIQGGNAGCESARRRASRSMRRSSHGRHREPRNPAHFTAYRHHPSPGAAVLDRRRTGLRPHGVDADPSGRDDLVRAHPGPRHQRGAAHLSSRSGQAAEDPRQVRDRGVHASRDILPKLGVPPFLLDPDFDATTDLPRLDYRDEGSLLAEIRSRVNAKFSKQDLRRI